MTLDLISSRPTSRTPEAQERRDAAARAARARTMARICSELQTHEITVPTTIDEEDQRALRSALDQLPELAPDPKPRRSLMQSIAVNSGVRLASNAAHDEETDFRNREEATSIEARLTVYALNAAIMLFAFPVGFALLIFNILGGENLRTTAHAMALTGMGIAIGWTELGAAIYASI
ncbi:MAG: hypothetical protein AAFR35_03665 [Pseudomonadota bacterium]